jgi:hypothetical protein
MIYQAHCSFMTPEGERTLVAVFEAMDNPTAIEGSFRWSRDRERSLNWTLSCVKVSEYPIGQVESDGKLRTGCRMPFFEWKYDWGVPRPC